MNIDVCSIILGHIDFKTYPAACLVCREWREIAARLHSNGAALSPILRLLTAYPTQYWDWRSLSSSKHVPIWYILGNPSMGWVAFIVCGRADMTIEYIRDFPEFKYNWGAVVDNPAIPVEHLLTLPIAEFYAIDVSQRPDITLEVVQLHPEFPWHMEYIARALGVDYIIAHPEIKWPFHTITKYYS